jgi:competence protein ComEA
MGINMIKRMMTSLLFVFAALAMTVSSAFADVEINKADQSALDGVKGIGPKLSRAILTARQQGGDFKDWSDFAERVQGVGAKSTDKLSQAGLLVNGRSKPGAPAAPVKNAEPLVPSGR